MFPLDQRHLLGLTHPGDEQRERRLVVVLLKQGLDSEGERLWALEAFELPAPEPEVGCRRAALVPAAQRLRDVLGRLHLLAAADVRDVADRCGGETVPPLG